MDMDWNNAYIKGVTITKTRMDPNTRMIRHSEVCAESRLAFNTPSSYLLIYPVVWLTVGAPL